jgi:Na+/melibiose symporter-like transporter
VKNTKKEKSEEKSKLDSREIGKNFKAFTLYLLAFSVLLFILSTLLMFTKRKNTSKEININLLLSDDNENENKKESDEVKKASENEDINQLDFIKRNINIKNIYIEMKNMVNKAMKSKKFIIFLFISILESPVPSMIFALYREMGETEKIQQLFLISIGPINFIFECVGGFAFGVLCDYVKKQYLLLFILGFNALTSFIYCVTFKNDITFFLATNFVSFTSGGFYSVKDCFIMGVFGVEIYVELIALVNFCVALVIIGLTPLASILDDKKKQTGYWTIFSILGILTLVGFVLCFYVKENTYTFDKIIDYDDDNNDNDNDKNKDNTKDSTNEEKKDEEETLK